MDLNRQVERSCIVRASYVIVAARDRVEQLPVVVPEGRNPPVASDAERAAREHKIPFIYSPFLDHLAVNPLAAARQFVVECKRLTTSSRSWVYTEQYVRSGVMRFITDEHAYGKDAPSGAMVGDLQAIELDIALQEVNACAVREQLPTLCLSSRNVCRAA